MLIKDLKQKLCNAEFSHCTDGIISLVLNRPRTDIKSTDSIDEKEAELCEEIENNWRESFPLAYQRGKTRFRF